MTSERSSFHHNHVYKSGQVTSTGQKLLNSYRLSMYVRIDDVSIVKPTEGAIVTWSALSNMLHLNE